MRKFIMILTVGVFAAGSAFAGDCDGKKCGDKKGDTTEPKPTAFPTCVVCE